MRAKKVSNIKIPTFDKKNYNLQKRKIMLLIKTGNLLYSSILENRPQTYIHEIIVKGKIISVYLVPINITKYTDTEKKVALDDSLQFIIIESLHNAKQI